MGDGSGSSEWEEPWGPTPSEPVSRAHDLGLAALVAGIVAVVLPVLGALEGLVAVGLGIATLRLATWGTPARNRGWAGIGLGALGTLVWTAVLVAGVVGGGHGSNGPRAATATVDECVVHDVGDRIEATVGGELVGGPAGSVQLDGVLIDDSDHVVAHGSASVTVAPGETARWEVHDTVLAVAVDGRVHCDVSVY